MPRLAPRNRTLAALALLLAGAGCRATAPPATAPAAPLAPVPAREETAHAIARALRERVGSPGLAAAVAIDGAIVWSEGFGEADVESHVPVTRETRFRIGSISKLFTVAALAKLVEKGALDLDAPIATLVPNLPAHLAAAEPAITPRLLSGHLGGIRHYVPKDYLVPLRSYAELAEGLPLFVDDPLVAPPGTKYNYSSYGYNLLGRALEGAAHERFLELLEESVILPLDLAHTRADVPRAIVPGRARPYLRDEAGNLANERPIDPSYKWPSGGLISTVDDLVRFASAHLSGRGYLADETLRLLFTSQRTAAGEETGVGIGWRTARTEAGRLYHHHGGSIEGGRATLVLLPEERIAVAILTNLSGSRFDERDALKLAEPFLPSAH